MRALVTGASGLLGSNLCLLSCEKHEITGVTHRAGLKAAPFKTVSLDLTEDGAFQKLLQETTPQVVIHCAALADVDACELDPQGAQQINAQTPASMAALCQAAGIGFLHISTDAVFDGVKGDYCEEDEPNPLSVYARSKLEGECGVLAAHAGALVLRVNFYGFSLGGKRSLAEFFLNHLQAGEAVNGFTDVFFCPLYVADLVDIIWEMIVRDLNGLYHVVSPQHLSKYDFGMNIAAKFGLDGSLIRPVSVQDGNLLARRSPNLTLRVTKMVNTGVTLPTLAAGLERFHKDFQEGHASKIRALAD